MDTNISSPHWGQFSGISAFNRALLQDGRFSVTLDGGIFECFFRKQPGRFLFVLLSGARNPEKSPLPKFDRWSWGKHFPGSMLCISDPAFFLKSGTLALGWYAGTDKHNWPLRMSGLVTAVARKLGRETGDVIVYGSSGGGFASLMLASRLGDATAIAINPQIDVFKYYKIYVKALLSECFSGREEKDLLSVEKARLTVIPSLLRSKRTKYVIVQNLLDHHHYKHHYPQFCRALELPLTGGRSNDGRGLSIIYSSPSGHGREPEELIGDIIIAGVNLATAKTFPDEMVVATPASFLDIDLHKTHPPRIRANQLYLTINKSQVLDGGEFLFRALGRGDLAPYALNLPLDWSADPYKDNNWCGQLHMWRMIDNHLSEFDRTEDPGLLLLPINLMCDWYRYHVTEGRGSRFSWMDMIVGMRAMKIAYVLSAYRVGKIPLGVEQIQIFQSMIELHLDFLLNAENVLFSNHTFIDMHGLAALRSIIKGERAVEIDTFLGSVIPRLIARQFNAAAVHLENSTGYQKFGIGCLKRLQNSGWFSQYKLNELLQKADAVNDWFKMPDGRTVPIGDTDGSQMTGGVKSCFVASNQIFSSTGYVIYRDDGRGLADRASYLFFMGAFNSKFHKQADDLSITWFEGEDILCDAGKFAYKASEMRGYVLSTRAHNTIEIDGRSYGESIPKRPRFVYGSAVKMADLRDWGIVVTGEVIHEEFAVRHTRHMLYGPKEWLLIIDVLQSSDELVPHQFTQWLHFSPHLNIDAQSEHRYGTVLISGRRLDILARGSGQITSTLVRGQTEPVRQGWISQAYGDATPNAALGFMQTGRSRAVFATVLSIDCPSSNIEFIESDLIRFSRAGAPTGIGGLDLRLLDCQCDIEIH